MAHLDQPAPVVLRALIGNLRCASCVHGVQTALGQIEGVREARVNLVTQDAYIVSGEQAPGDVEGLKTRVRLCLEAMGYSVDGWADEAVSEPLPVDRSVGGRGTSKRSITAIPAQWLRPLLALLLALPVVAIGMAHVRGPVVDGLSFSFSTAILALAAKGILLPGLRKLAAWRPDMDSLVALGTLAAWGASTAALWTESAGHGAMGHSDGGIRGVYFEAAAATLAAVMVGRQWEEWCLAKAASALKSLDDRVPSLARRLDPTGAEQIVPTRELKPGDRVLIQPGDLFPVDGVVLLGRGEVDESLLTGESAPVVKQRGSAVFGGTINGTGSYQIRATAAAGESAAARLAQMVRHAQMDRPPLQRLADRASGVFVPVVILLAVATVGVWWSLGAGVGAAILYGVAVLVVACPCALGLATPLAIVAATGMAARSGIHFRDAGALERLARCYVVMLDKTGTLTEGRPRVVAAEPSVGDPVKSWLLDAATVEAPSEHPWARAILEYARLNGWKPGEAAEEWNAVPGCGVEGRVGGRLVRVGREDWVARGGNGADRESCMAETGTGGGHVTGKSGLTSVAVGVNKRLVGRLYLEDSLRPDAMESVGRLKAMGLRPLMVTGDEDGPARIVASALQIDHASRVRDKKSLVEREQASGRRVAMVGDGLNDAPALAQADCGIALQSGTGLAQHSAHVLILGGRLGALPDAVLLARRTVAVIRQNLGWALGYNLLGIPLAAGVFVSSAGVSLSPAAAGVFMAFSSLAVSLNSLRLLGSVRSTAR